VDKWAIFALLLEAGAKRIEKKARNGLRLPFIDR
jgi:hypothetical protein